MSMTTLALKSTYVDLPEPDFLFDKPLSTFRLSDEQKAWIAKVVEESAQLHFEEDAA